MDAKNISTELKAAYLIGLFAGTNSCSKNKKMNDYRKKLYPHAITAIQIVYEDGAFNPIAVYKMEEFYNRICDESKRQADGCAVSGEKPFSDVISSE
ncbi:hypothetical protein KA005_31790 [bacterium]|nr:hypothetical protein [bacterium]